MEINRQRIIDNAKILNILIHIETQIFDIVADIEQSPYLCARMRRASYKMQDLVVIKSLGHHFDDVIETTLMSMLIVDK